MQRTGIIDMSGEKEGKKEETQRVALESSICVEWCGSHDFPNWKMSFHYLVFVADVSLSASNTSALNYILCGCLII